MKYPLPDEALDDRLAVIGTAGAGKTYLTLGAVEHLQARSSRVILVDPLGVAWGLRLDADGKTPSRFQPVIFGGAHGDLPINEHAGAIIGEAVATSRDSCIIDLSELGTKAAERRFMLAFLTALYRNADKEPVHLIVDEADMFAPQRLLDKDGDAAKLLGMMETIVRRGRVQGFIPWLLTQRPAVLSKDVLSQADGIIALKLTAKQDQDAVGGWIEATADKAQWQAIRAGLATKKRGEGVIWIPARGILKEATFPSKTTFDSSRTPKRGERVRAATLKPIDLGALKDKLATVEAEVTANDPKSLRAEIGKLRAELAKKSAPAGDGTAALKDREAAFGSGKREGLAEGYGAGWKAGWRAGHQRGAKDQMAAISALPMAAAPDAPNVSPDLKFATAPTASVKRVSPPDNRPQAVAPHIGRRTYITLPPGERAVLIAAAQFGGVEREQLTILTGYKRSSRDAYIQRLREKGFVEVDGSTIRMTPDGEAALPADYEPLPTGAGLQEYWLSRLPEGERKILQCLIDAYPGSVARADLDEMTGYKRSSRDAYLQRMKAKRLWEHDGAAVRASEVLF